MSTEALCNTPECYFNRLAVTKDVHSITIQEMVPFSLVGQQSPPVFKSHRIDRVKFCRPNGSYFWVCSECAVDPVYVNKAADNV